MVKGLEGRLYEKQLKSLVLFRLEETKGRPGYSLQLLHEERGGSDINILYVVTSNQWQSKGMA